MPDQPPENPPAQNPPAESLPPIRRRLPLEDNFADIIDKAQRGRGVTNEELAARARITLEELGKVKRGEPRVPLVRSVARALRLSPDALAASAQNTWYPEQPVFAYGFFMSSTAYENMRVNSYVVWDPKTRATAVFDTGSNCSRMLDVIKAENLVVRYIFLTHTHDDHVADLRRLAAKSGGDVWASEHEPAPFYGSQRFKENAYFHLGSLSIKTLLTCGHSPGLTTFFIQGLSWPLAIVGDAIFAGSMGGSITRFEEQLRNNRQKIMTLPRDTVIAPGHGPLTTVAQEKLHNPFFAS